MLNYNLKFFGFLILVFLFIFIISCGEKQGELEPDYIDGKPVFESGDIIGHYSNADFLGFFRNVAKSDFNHVGIIIVNDGIPMVFEATGGGVGFNSLDNFSARGNGKYTVLRVKPENSEIISNVIEQALFYNGISYDNSFKFSDEKIYCSELVYKAYQKGGNLKVGNIQQVKDVIGIQQYNPIFKGIAGNFVKDISMDQEVIMPDSIMKSVKFNIIHQSN
ncbi:MAG: hypothetical protein M0R46_11345 [Candidatus Muirbacterium halophilum]|jgi:hypothetical protein|nr:hypothetical protein [Candidatus Muirbacterium halophilum]MCK9476508.1 hypothetical protein [Candidatus Muirbacterium halophilum]